MRISREQITGLVLSGGRGTRMGHVDKGLQPLNDSSLIEATLHRLQPQVGTLIINANQNLQRYQQFGFQVCADEIAGYAGPLAGLHAGLSRCATPYLVSVPCDTPGFPEDLVEKLSRALADAEADLAFAVTGDPHAPELHPVFCLMKREVLVSLDDYLRNGGRKVASWMQQQRHAQAYFNDQLAFMNINTQDELKTFTSLRRP